MTTSTGGRVERWLRLGVKVGVFAPLVVAAAACSSSGNSGSVGSTTTTPPTSPPPPPPPPPSPPPPAPADFETTEYFTSGGLATIGASTAYAEGATGAGVRVAVIDSGVDATHPDLVGQVVASFDVQTSRAADDLDPEGHGTLVTGIVAALRDDSGVMGTAFEADILDIRADRANSCALSCDFSDPDLVSAIELAVANGADVINMSLGGPIDGNSTLETAIFEAAEAGVLVVISAGNSGDPSPHEPAYIAGDAQALGRVVTVGAIDPDGNITDFTNRAGDDTQNFYLLAPGDFVDDDDDGVADRGVVSTGVDDDIDFPGDAQNDADSIGDYYFVSGTSFAAPHVAGALALVLEAFPNLEPEEALALLLETADDYTSDELDAVLNVTAGAGTDAVSGVGILNLAEAFTPQGTTSLSFGAAAVSLETALAPASGAFGDWATASGAFSDLVFQDSYNRGFLLSNAKISGEAAMRFHDFETRARYHEGDWGAVSAGRFSMDWFTPAVRVDPFEPYAPEPDSSFTTRFAFRGGEIRAGRGSTPEALGPRMSLLSDPSAGATDLGGADVWALVAHDVGSVRAQVFSESSEGRDSVGVGLVRKGEGWTVRGALVSEGDERAALGGALQSRFGAEDEVTATALKLEASAAAAAGWTLRAMAERTDASLDGVDADGIWTSAWAVSAERPYGRGVFSLSLAQPRRAEGGRIAFDAPVEMTSEGELIFERRFASLTPSGREIDIEARWRAQLSDTLSFESSAAWIYQPNHVAQATGAAAAWIGVRSRW